MKVSEHTLKKQVEQGMIKKEIGTVMGVIGQSKTDFDWAGNFPLGEGEPTIKGNFKLHDIEIQEQNQEIKKLKKEILTLQHIVFDLLEQQENDMKGEF